VTAVDVELSEADQDHPDVERLVALLLVDIAVRYQSDEPEPPLGPSAGFLLARP
jgi:hypothetical protein